jgi:hypothetical protein
VTEILRWMATCVLVVAAVLVVVKWINQEIEWRDERRRKRWSRP